MDAQQKTSSSFKAGKLEESASKPLPNTILDLLQNQQTTQEENSSYLTQPWVASLLVRIAYWEMLLAALAVLFLGRIGS